MTPSYDSSINKHQERHAQSAKAETGPARRASVRVVGERGGGMAASGRGGQRWQATRTMAAGGAWRLRVAPAPEQRLATNDYTSLARLSNCLSCHLVVFVYHATWSSSRMTSPAEVHDEDRRTSICIWSPQPDSATKVRIISAWLMQNTNTFEGWGGVGGQGSTGGGEGAAGRARTTYKGRIG